ncbi:MAG: hypothetical protein KDB82_13280, partial [Planctomycetes bacterium]|nr:hypothetical protein [Planctomycetota bacterium]
LILVIVLVIAFSGGGNSGSSGGGDDAGTADGGSSVAQVDPDQRLLEEMQKQYNSKDALSLDQVRQYYQQAREHKDKEGFKAMQTSWSKALREKALAGASADDLADIALMLDDDKYPEGRELLDQAWKALKNAKKATREVTTTDDEGHSRKTFVVNKKFSDIVTRLGWKPYTYPAEMNNYVEYEVEGAQEFSSYFYRDVDDTFRDVELYPPEIVKKLETMQSAAEENWKKLEKKDKEDGFALKARKAWIRFKHAQGGGKVNREKGQRSFSAKAMERESESFDKIWTYTYWKPFMVYVEKPIGQDELDEAFLESLASKAALLKHEYDWFDKNMIQEFSLQRQKPKGYAEQAEREGWPLEIIVLKDRETFEKFCTDTMGQPMPGARAFYSPLEERVMTYDDTSDSSADTAWFNESVLIHETFHMLSDFYHANPIFDMEELQRHPSYTSILVQEGLTESVSGFAREGTGAGATYEFMQVNHLRLRSFKNVYELLKNNTLFRIRDLIQVRNYGQAQEVAFDRAKDLKINPMWAAGNALGIYYPTACQAATFFQHYKKNGKYVYRDKWWKLIGMDYKGELVMSSYRDNKGIAKFKEIFGIKDDADWDALDKEWLDYIMDLKPEDVGKDAGGQVEGPEKSITPAPIDPPQDPAPDKGLGQEAPDAALPGRDED